MATKHILVRSTVVITVLLLLTVPLIHQIAPDQMLPARLGGLLVGASIFVQGYLHADEDRGSQALADGVLVRSLCFQASYMLALLGTVLTVAGDWYVMALTRG